MTSAGAPQEGLAVSPWVDRWLRLAMPASGVLDVACGFGRHSRLAVAQGHKVVALDLDADSLASFGELSGVHALRADIETEGWPLAGKQFDVVIVTNYLHRALFDVLLDSVTESGLLIYETFAHGNERFGRPSNPAFLLRPGELLDVARPALRVLGYEDLFVEIPKQAMVQRICACGPQFQFPTGHR